MTENTQDITRAETKLLLFLETQAVDSSGCVDTRCMNTEDMELASEMAGRGIICWGRLPAHYIMARHTSATHYVILSEAAFKAAHKERVDRAGRTRTRMWAHIEAEHDAVLPTEPKAKEAEHEG